MRHDEAQVGADEAVLGLGGGGDGVLQRHAALAVGELLGGLAAGLDDARELALVLGGEQGNLADVVQVQADGVIHCVVVQPFVCWVRFPTVLRQATQRASRRRGRGTCVRSSPAGVPAAGGIGETCRIPGLSSWRFTSRSADRRGSAATDVVRVRTLAPCRHRAPRRCNRPPAPATRSACSAARSTRRTSATSSPPSTSATPSTLDVVILMVANVPWQKEGEPARSPRPWTAWRWSRRPSPTSPAWRPGGWRSSRRAELHRRHAGRARATDPGAELFTIVGDDAAAGLHTLGAVRGGRRPVDAGRRRPPRRAGRAPRRRRLDPRRGAPPRGVEHRPAGPLHRRPPARLPGHRPRARRDRASAACTPWSRRDIHCVPRPRRPLLAARSLALARSHRWSAPA